MTAAYRIEDATIDAEHFRGFVDAESAEHAHPDGVDLGFAAQEAAVDLFGAHHEGAEGDRRRAGAMAGGG